MIQKMWRRNKYATAADVRTLFGDYHNALRWLALFLLRDEESAEACVVDACTIAHTQQPVFHEWLVHWAALATLRCAFHRQQGRIAELAKEYEQRAQVELDRTPLSVEHLRLLIRSSDRIGARLDELCRFVLIMRGIAKDTPDEVAAKLRIGRLAVEQAYGAAFDVLTESLQREREKQRRYRIQVTQ
jgi:DNA-directed RNA polymerase specialized sigma24 family protein